MSRFITAQPRERMSRNTHSHWQVSSLSLSGSWQPFFAFQLGRRRMRLMISLNNHRLTKTSCHDISFCPGEADRNHPVGQKSHTWESAVSQLFLLEIKWRLLLGCFSWEKKNFIQSSCLVHFYISIDICAFSIQRTNKNNPSKSQQYLLYTMLLVIFLNTF